jgi:hypothetical protein
VHIKGRLEANQHLVAALRDALLDRDELVGREIGAVLDAAGGPLPAATIDTAAADTRADEAAAAVIDLRDEVVEQRH